MTIEATLAEILARLDRIATAIERLVTTTETIARHLEPARGMTGPNAVLLGVLAWVWIGKGATAFYDGVRAALKGT